MSIIGDLYYGLDSGTGGHMRAASPMPSAAPSSSHSAGEEVELDEVAGELEDSLDALRTPLDTTGGGRASLRGFFSTRASAPVEPPKAPMEKPRGNRTVIVCKPMPHLMSIDPRLGSAYVYVLFPHVRISKCADVVLQTARHRV